MSNRYQSLSFTTASIGAGSTLNIDRTGLPSLFNIVKVKAVPFNINGTFSLKIYKKDTFLATDLLAAWLLVPGNLYYPVDISTGLETEALEGPGIPYDDIDNSGELHLSIINNGSITNTYTIIIEYEEIGKFDSFGNLTLRGTVNIGIASLISTNFNFSAQFPGGTLTGGVLATITLFPVPKGINGVNTNHYLYISGGSGTAEAILITGGSAVSGATSGTITFTPANSHSGAWSIESATGGVQEAINYANYAEIYIPSLITLRKTITIGTGQRITLKGIERNIQCFIPGTNFTVGDMITVVGGTLTTRDIAMGDFSNASNRANISGYGGSSSLNILNTSIGPGKYGIFCDTANLFADGCNYLNGVVEDLAIAGIYITSTLGGTTNLKIFNSVITGYPMSNPNLLQHGLYLEAVDGAIIDNVWFGGAANPIALSCTATKQIINCYISHCLLDAFLGAGIFFTGMGAVGSHSVRISDCHIVGQGYPSCTGIDFSYGYTPSTNFDQIHIIGNNINTNSLDGIRLGANLTGKSILISDNIIVNNNRSNSGYVGIRLAAGVSGIHIKNNLIGNKAPYSSASQNYGITIEGNVTDCEIVGNDLSDNLLGPLNLSGTFSGLIRDNKGLDNILTESLVSAGTVTLGVYPFYKITGTTTIATINGGWIGRKITLQFTNAAPGGVSAAGNIYIAKTIVQNGILDFLYDGTKWMVNAG